jgi:glycosyltransferase involved in cell wall biosynthesis
LNTHLVLAHEAEGRPWLEDLDAAGVTWSILPAKRRAWRAHLDRVVKERSGVLVHAHFTAADLQSAGAAASAGVPCVWHIRTGFNGYPLLRRASDLIKMRIVARRSVAKIIAVSPWLAEFARRRGAPAERIEVVENAITTERFAQMPDAAAARERFGLDPDALVVLGLGWWPEVKGVDVFVDALQDLAARRPQMAALLVGEERMRSFLAERLTEPPPWLHVTGFVLDSAWLFAAADIFVSASRHEGQSSAIGEALACGLPVVMSDIPGTAGWGPAPGLSTFPSEDAKALGAQLERLLDDSPGARAAAGAQNREWVRENFAIERWTERICAIYRTLLGDLSGARAPSEGGT